MSTAFLAIATSASAASAVEVYVTTPSGSELVARQPPVAFDAPASADTTITIDRSHLLQPWLGVGGALTDSAATVISSLPVGSRVELMRRLFGQGNGGAGFTLARVAMGASDFSSIGDYNYQPKPNGPYTFAHDETAIIPLLVLARAFSPTLAVFATPWSPPGWMKTSGTMNGGQFNTQDYAPLAAYFSAFVEEYTTHGVPIFAVSPQNEPLNNQSGYPSELLPAQSEATFIADYLAPRLRKDGLAWVRIFGLEDNWADLAYLDTLAASSAAPFIAGYDFHCYKGSPTAMAAAAAPGRINFMTECSGTAGGTFAQGLAYHMSQIVIGGITNGASGLLEWNLALDPSGGPTNGGCKTCIGLATVDASTSPAITYSAAYYALSQVSRFARPGARAIGSTATGTGIAGGTLRNADGSLVLVTFNSARTARTLRVVDGRSSFGYTLPAGAAATFVWN